MERVKIRQATLFGVSGSKSCQGHKCQIMQEIR
jgi:hypothetical protein